MNSWSKRPDRLLLMLHLSPAASIDMYWMTAPGDSARAIGFGACGLHQVITRKRRSSRLSIDQKDARPTTDVRCRFIRASILFCKKVRLHRGVLLDGALSEWCKLMLPSRDVSLPGQCCNQGAVYCRLQLLLRMPVFTKPAVYTTQHSRSYVEPPSESNRDDKAFARQRVG
jgi:hypothetical protein